MIEGTVAAGFEPVREEFARNFAERGELGAACAIQVDGELVVDLWGGYRDRAGTQPWQRDTLATVYSSTKGVASMAVAVAHSRGLFDYDALVTKYWPEFGQAGKENVTVRQLLGFQAGLPTVDTPLTPELLADPDRLGEVLARQAPAWAPGTAQGYHPLVGGLYVSQLLRRVDPKGRLIGRYLADEVLVPLGIEFYIGTPPTIPEERIAELVPAKPALRDFTTPGGVPTRMLLEFMLPWTLTAKSFSNPRLRDITALSRPPWRELDLPAGNGVGTARSLAALYGEFATGGSRLGVDRATLRAIEADPVPLGTGSRDRVMHLAEARFSLGFWKPFAAWRFGTDSRAYGTPGAGGSFGMADPATRSGFGYVPNRLGRRLWNDPREAALREAFQRCL
ncbi:beta-lactamase family protein [Allokutzneria sp. A3M-2-11 16]|uniref:serine hydrolase domain-containing protein n=1 Tax=Allokutzneria sp. A3M-2-11 16 TaxID=2962043 RepID=UPI0020B70E3C|nr:serine hydrolase domain-containing protein [Allokutzneria sp. A3M-2-11 16]MCP3803587.1 beta-lactamase family protein [Allokutzneria sp. A3M-2-11 16]